MQRREFVIRQARVEDIPSIDDLLKVSGLAKSRDPDPFKGDDLEIWLNTRLTLALVACPVDELSLVVSHAQVSRKVSKCRASRADLEDVATRPGFTGQDLSRRILAGLFWHAWHRWEATRVEWECGLERGDSRGFYLHVIGASVPTPDDSFFKLPLEWQIPAKYREALQPYYKDPLANTPFA